MNLNVLILSNSDLAECLVFISLEPSSTKSFKLLQISRNWNLRGRMALTLLSHRVSLIDFKVKFGTFLF